MISSYSLYHCIVRFVLFSLHLLYLLHCTLCVVLIVFFVLYSLCSIGLYALSPLFCNHSIPLDCIHCVVFIVSLHGMKAAQQRSATRYAIRYSSKQYRAKQCNTIRSSGFALAALLLCCSAVVFLHFCSSAPFPMLLLLRFWSTAPRLLL